MEHHRFHSGNYGLFNPKIGSSDPVDEASEPKQSSEGFHVFYNHRLHHWVYSMRNFPLAAVQPSQKPVGSGR